jgi:tetratricopeptide (TPR) repeat protein
VLAGSSVFAQSLADAKRAIDAEQYQKAKTMLKNLTVTQASNEENFFQLGWVYLLQDYTDSAKTVFTKGVAVNPKSALNYAGLGAVAHLTKDAAGKSANFAQVAALTGKKDSKPWLYMGRGLLMVLPGNKKVNGPDAEAAKAALDKARLANPKDAEAALELGNAYRAMNNTSLAYENYSTALTLDPKYPAANVAQGVQWKNAHNFEGAIEEFKKALAIDPNYGPAYREWAETDLLWSFENRAVASQKINDGVENYKKYMSLTDESDETLMRYADFLISAGKYVELQEVAAKLAKSAGSNIRALRYLGYAAYENKNYPVGINALNNWFSKAAPERILPRDYFYRGRLQIATKDTVGGIATIQTAIDKDSTLADDGYKDILAIHKKRGDYLGQARTYEEMTRRIRNRSTFSDGLYAGIYYYFAFGKTKDSTLLVKADTAISRTLKAATTFEPNATIYKARIQDAKDNKDLTKTAGLAKPFYDKYIENAGPTFNIATATSSQKTYLSEAYAYQGNYALYHDKDDVKAMEFYTKAKEIDPSNSQAKFYFEQKAAAAAPAPKKATK